MDKVTEGQLFKPASKAEAKGDATTRAAREIIARETAARDAKTERLKRLRLEKEEAEQAVADAEAAAAAAAKPKKRAKKTATT